MKEEEGVSVYVSVNSTWNKTIIITGDTNTYYLKRSVALTRYKEVIETCNLKLHITIPKA